MLEFYMVGQRALWVNVHHTARKPETHFIEDSFIIDLLVLGIQDGTLVRCTWGKLECE